MSKTTEKATAATPAKATEVQNVAAEATAAVSESVTKATGAVTGLFNAYFAATRNAVTGVIEVDKALFGYAKDAVTGYYKLGQDTFRAKSLDEVIEMHTAYAHANIEATAANARELVELTKDKAQEAYAPIKEVIETYRPGKAA